MNVYCTSLGKLKPVLSMENRNPCLTVVQSNLQVAGMCYKIILAICNFHSFQSCQLKKGS